MRRVSSTPATMVTIKSDAENFGIDAPPLPPLPLNLPGTPSTAQTGKDMDSNIAGHHEHALRMSALNTEVVEMELNLNQPDDFERRRSNSLTLCSPTISRGAGTASSRHSRSTVDIHAQLREDYMRRARVYSNNMVHQQLRDTMDSMQQSLSKSSESILALVSRLELEGNSLRRENDRLQAQMRTATRQASAFSRTNGSGGMDRTIDSSQSFLRAGTPMSLDQYESCFHISGSFKRFRSERADMHTSGQPEPKLRESGFHQSADPASTQGSEPPKVVAAPNPRVSAQIRPASPPSRSKTPPASARGHTPVETFVEEASETEAEEEVVEEVVHVESEPKEKEKDGNPHPADNKRTRGARNREPQSRREEIQRRAATQAKLNQAQQKVKEEHKKAVFASATEMKDRIRLAIGKNDYNVFDKYKNSGLAQRVARSREFEYVTMAVISFNALWMSIETDHNDESVIINAPKVFLIMETFFCIYFLVEVVVRFAAFRKTCDALQDTSFLFDTALVVTMYLESWGLSILSVVSGSEATDAFDPSILRLIRLVRVFRIARVVRLLKNMPELMVLIKGMVTATRSVFFTLCLLVLIIYVFGILFTSLIGSTEVGQMYFSSVGATMNSLLLHGCFLEDFPAMAKAVLEESYLVYGMLISFVLLAALTVMNMLVGVLVEVVSVVAAVEKEQLTVTFLQDRMCDALKQLGKLGGDDEYEELADVRISKQDFLALLGLPSAARVLRDVGIDVVSLVDLVDYIFQDDIEFSNDYDLPFRDFMDLMLQMRGNNTATVRDLVELRKYLKQRLGFLERLVTGLNNDAEPDTGMQGVAKRLAKGIREW